MAEKIFILSVSLLIFWFISKSGTVLSQEDPPPESPSIHQRASTCWNNFEFVFADEPVNCQEVCDRCHTFATVVPSGSGNPEAVTTDETYPEGQEDGVNWDTIGMHQQSCRDCHTDITESEPDKNHAVFVRYEMGQEFKATDLKLFDEYILCTTCHSPHLENIALLRTSNHGSMLCLNCHTT